MHNNTSSALIWVIAIGLAVMIGAVTLTQPALARPVQAAALVAAGLVLAVGILLGAWLAKVIVVTLNQPEESITIVQGNWLRVRSFDVRPLSEIVQVLIISHEEEVPRDASLGSISSVDSISGDRNGGSEDYASNRGPITYRSYGLKLIMRSDSDVALSARYGTWEEMQPCKDAITAFLSPFREFHTDHAAEEDEALPKKRTR